MFSNIGYPIHSETTFYQGQLFTILLPLCEIIKWETTFFKEYTHLIKVFLTRELYLSLKIL